MVDRRCTRWRLLAACLCALTGMTPAFAAPTVQDMLRYKPRQEGVNCSTPAADAEANCKVDLVKGTRGGVPVTGRGYLEMTGYAGTAMGEMLRE